MVRHAESLSRSVQVVNLDPAAEHFDYPVMAGEPCGGAAKGRIHRTTAFVIEFRLTTRLDTFVLSLLAVTY